MLWVTDAQLQAWLTSFLLPFFRILAIFSAAPILSMRPVPGRVRIGLSLLIAVTLAPALNGPALPLSDTANTLIIIAHEVSIGLAIGWTARLAFAAFDLAGEVIGLQMGLSYAGFFDPMGARSNAVGSLMSTTVSFLFVSMNGILVLMTALLSSFISLPMGLPSLAVTHRFDFIEMGRAVFASGLLLALPFIASILFVNLLMGVVSRVAPQLSLFSIGFPITITMGLWVLVNGLPWIERPLVEALTELLMRLSRPPLPLL